MFRQPLALGEAGGSLSFLGLRLLSGTLLSVPDPTSVTAVPDPGCECPVLDSSESSGLGGELDLRSCLIGVLFGISLGPMLELLLLIRHWWTSLVRRQLQTLARGLRPLYREI